MVSGDGEYVRHALTNEEGFQLARVWLEDGSSMGHWVPGCVNPEGSAQPGMQAAGDRHPDYQVLTASETCTLHEALCHSGFTRCCGGADSVTIISAFKRALHHESWFQDFICVQCKSAQW